MKLSEIRTKCELFCGGTFCFDYRKDGYEMMAAKDYRAKLLDSVESLFRPKGTNRMEISENVLYVGPFYFETESMRQKRLSAVRKR